MPRVSHLTALLPILVVALTGTVMAAPAGETDSLYPLLSIEDSWQRLPPTEKGGNQPLPSWARALAGPMPRTTAALLRLDLAHRTSNPLDPQLRAQMRWVAAHANHCAYAEAVAIADAWRAGLDDESINSLRNGDHSHRSPSDRAALEFARKMTVDSAGVTDGEFAALVQAFGEQKTAAMVLAMAYANFQDRLLLCLGSPLESGGPLAPLDVVFVPEAVETKMLKPPVTQASPLPKPTGSDLIEDGPEWASLSYEQLQEKLEGQKRKPTRLRVPKWDEVERGLPVGFMRPSRIVWNQVCLGYQPELACAWETLMRTNAAEMRGKTDRVFGISLFWIVTRTIDCPYCMGHCEQNWEVAGLSKQLIAERSRLLAGSDWSSFPAQEQRALAFARKLTQAPGSIAATDIESLKRDFGPERAIFSLVYACRCNYMTRISNGFQLSLERDNVFFDYYTDDKAKEKAK
jgi:alkylhydroperoxidase family enzyme